MPANKLVAPEIKNQRRLRRLVNAPMQAEPLASNEAQSNPQNVKIRNGLTCASIIARSEWPNAAAQRARAQRAENRKGTHPRASLEPPGSGIESRATRRANRTSTTRTLRRPACDPRLRSLCGKTPRRQGAKTQRTGRGARWFHTLSSQFALSPNDKGEP